MAVFCYPIVLTHSNRMGNNTAKSTVQNISEQITNVAMSSVQDCTVATKQSQKLDVSNSGFRLFGSYKATQATDVKSQCFSDVNRQSSLQNGIINAITQATTATGQSVLPAFGSTKSKAISNVTNIIRNNVNMSNIQKTYNSIKQKQSAKISNSGVVLFESVDLSQGATVFAAATLQEVVKSGVLNTISNHIDQDTTAKTESPLSGLFDGLNAMAMIFLFIVILVLAGVGYWVIRGDDDDAGRIVYVQQPSNTIGEFSS